MGDQDMHNTERAEEELKRQGIDPDTVSQDAKERLQHEMDSE